MSATKVPFVDLKAEYESMRPEIDAAVASVIQSGTFIQGPEVSSLEKELSAFIGAPVCISTASGTDAILIALMALGVGPGDEVVTTPFSFFAAAEMIALLGANPVFVDIDEASFNLNPALLSEAITSKCKAVIPVSLYGRPADMDEINAICVKKKVPVIEDAAQSFGADYKRRKSCNLSQISITSFFPTKPLGAYGDAGAIFCQDEVLGKKMRLIMNHGQAVRYDHHVIGVNGRMDAIQAAILRVKLRHFPEQIKLRQKMAGRYSQLLKGLPLSLPISTEDRNSAWAQYSVRVKGRSSVEKMLSD
ncbi:MAG: DegT/DnrJ/EryC1/StrS family aminotransferase, partial [Spirochaetia bacterium]|nr:DegT/DnrJ/EryC1/StrS family aminotransferase [Spirochaetia bacterium]